MKPQNCVLALYVSLEGKSNRTSKDVLVLDKKGVLEDKFYAKNIQRAILITSIDSYNLAKQNGIDTPFSSLGENILLDVNPYHLNIGDRLKVGETTLEITQNCTICNSLSKIDAKLPKLLENDRGIFAKVIESGVICVDDEVRFL
ncbi:MAG: MOSC domain-containing protein [Epsilonproteobacteria bacterium]|nr:MOSC domain-containing protein [Campylobacterota bacterium]